MYIRSGQCIHAGGWTISSRYEVSVCVVYVTISVHIPHTPEGLPQFMHATLLKHHNCIKLKCAQNSLLMQSTVVSVAESPKCFVTLLYECRRWIYVLLWLICVSWRFCFIQMLCGTFDKSKIFSMIFFAPLQSAGAKSEQKCSKIKMSKISGTKLKKAEQRPWFTGASSEQSRMGEVSPNGGSWFFN